MWMIHVLLLFSFVLLGFSEKHQYLICNSKTTGTSKCTPDKCCELSEAVKEISELQPTDSVELVFSPGRLEIGQSFGLKVNDVQFTGLTGSELVVSTKSSCSFELNFAGNTNLQLNNLNFVGVKSPFVCTSSANTTIISANVDGVNISDAESNFLLFEDVRQVKIDRFRESRSSGNSYTFDFRSQDVFVLTFSNGFSIDSNNYGLIGMFSALSSTLSIDHVNITKHNEGFGSIFHLECHGGASISAIDVEYSYNDNPLLNVSSFSSYGVQITFESSHVFGNSVDGGIVLLWSETGSLSSIFKNNLFEMNHVWKSAMILYIIGSGDGVFSIVHSNNKYVHNQRQHMFGLDGCAVRIRKFEAMDIPYLWIGHDVLFQNEYFYDNRAYSSYGGAIAMTLPDQGFVALKECIFDSNTAAGSSDVGGGGAISFYGMKRALLYMKNTIFRLNRATYGGAIFCNDFEHVQFLMTNVTFFANQAVRYEDVYSRGGAIYVTKMFSKYTKVQSNFTIRVQNSTFEGNMAATGGAICNIFDSSLLIVANFFNTKFIGNAAMSDGGAILLLDSIIEFENCEFKDNTLNQKKKTKEEIHSGGALQTRGCDLVIRGSSFKSNYASDYGGALFSWLDGTVLIEDSEFWKNNAGAVGGSIYIETGGFVGMDRETRVFHSQSSFGGGIFIALRTGGVGEVYSQVDSNNARVSGGGIYVWHGSPTIDFKNVFNNTADSGPDYMSMPTKFVEKITSSLQNYCSYKLEKGNVYKYLCDFRALIFYDIYDQVVDTATPKNYEILLTMELSDGSIEEEWWMVGQTSLHELLELYLDNPQKQLKVTSNLTMYAMQDFTHEIHITFEKYEATGGGKGKGEDKKWVWIMVISSAVLLPVVLLCCFVCCVLCCWCGQRGVCFSISLFRKKKKAKGKRSKSFYERL